MIKFNNFYYSYQYENQIYQGLNLEMTSGKIYGLFGKNGAGKSTLLKNICGLNRPTKGSVIVNNYVPQDRKPSFLSDIFMIPEEIYIPPMSQINFIKIYGAFYPKFSFDQLCDNLDKLGVPEKNKLNKLSFGQKKKFMIAFALACNTKIVIMDEPTNGLDIPSKGLFRKLISSSINNDRLFIISTHQVKDLDDILDHVLIVDNGNLLLNENMDNISKKITFKFYTDKPLNNNIVSIEAVSGGYSVMERNIANEDSNVNFEQLFNTSIIKPEEITSLFQPIN